jgi:antitoxin VapB
VLQHGSQLFRVDGCNLLQGLDAATPPGVDRAGRQPADPDEHVDGADRRATGQQSVGGRDNASLEPGPGPASVMASFDMRGEWCVQCRVMPMEVDALYQVCYLSTMAMNIKDPQTEALAAEVAALANETKTQAVRTALLERKERLQARKRRHARGQRIDRFLEEEAWPQIPDAVLGRPVSKAERETILGYGPEGV